MAAGRNLIAAKEDVAHGEWLPMLEEIGVDESYARRLMQVSRNPAISNQANLPDLPTRFAVLREIARMDPDDIEDGIERGHITPRMTIEQAKSYATGDTKSEATLGESVEKALGVPAPQPPEPGEARAAAKGTLELASRS